jgi:hypothetical protein
LRAAAGVDSVIRGAKQAPDLVYNLPELQRIGRSGAHRAERMP